MYTMSHVYCNLYNYDLLWKYEPLAFMKWNRSWQEKWPVIIW